MLKLIDVGRDNGLTIGPGNLNYYQVQVMMQGRGEGLSMIAFKIPDASALREQAYKLAIEDARSKSARLADLAGVKLGRILSVRDQDAPPAGKNDLTSFYYAMYGMTQPKGEPDVGLSSNVFGEIPLTVRLNVEFEIVK